MDRIVYSKHTFDPITVISLTPKMLDALSKAGKIKLVLDPHRFVILETSSILPEYGEPVEAIVTEQEENALLMMASWLPGQRTQINIFKKKIKHLQDRLNDDYEY